MRVSFHLVDIPIDTQIAAFQKVGPGRIEPEREAARKCLFILGEWREGIDDRAAIVSSDDAGMDGEDTDVRILCIAFC